LFPKDPASHPMIKRSPCMSRDNHSLPTPSFFCSLGFRLEKFGSSGSADGYLQGTLLPFLRRERPAGKSFQEKTQQNHLPLLNFLGDRPGPRDDEPPQDDDPNFSSLNPMGSTLLFPDSCRQRGFLVQKLGVGKICESCIHPAFGGLPPFTFEEPIRIPGENVWKEFLICMYFIIDIPTS